MSNNNHNSLLHLRKFDQLWDAFHRHLYKILFFAVVQEVEF